VAAVGGASILGMTAPVRAASVVTYTLENAELADGDDVTGSIYFDVANDVITGANLTVESNNVPVDFFSALAGTGSATSVVLEDQQGYNAEIALTTALTGDVGEDVPLVTYNNNDSLTIPGEGEVEFAQGSVSDGSAGPSSVPEPSSILATVTAVTLGVVLRAKKRKV